MAKIIVLLKKDYLSHTSIFNVYLLNIYGTIYVNDTLAVIIHYVC